MKKIMTLIQLNKDRILAITPPAKATNFSIDEHGACLWYSLNGKIYSLELQSGSWQIIGWAGELNYNQIELFTESKQLIKGYKWQKDLSRVVIYSEWKSLMKANKVQDTDLILIDFRLKSLRDRL